MTDKQHKGKYDDDFQVDVDGEFFISLNVELSKLENKGPATLRLQRRTPSILKACLCWHIDDSQDNTGTGT